MQRVKFIFSIFVLTFSVVLASVLMSTDASAQCTWMDGLSVVSGFNNVRDYGWQRSWSPGLDEDWMAHYCGLGVESCSLRGQTASPADDPDPAPKPDVNKAIRSDTCPSAYDIDCCSTGCPSVGSCCSLGGCALAPAPECCGCGS